jgi:hypothetical protein
MQAYIPARNDPFHSSNESPLPPISKNTPADDAELSNSLFLRPELLAATKDTFANSSVLHTDTGLFHEPRKDPPINPGPGAQRVELLEYIKQQLDCFGKEPLLMNRYQLLGPDHRATGGDPSR